MWRRHTAYSNEPEGLDPALRDQAEEGSQVEAANFRFRFNGPRETKSIVLTVEDEAIIVTFCCGQRGRLDRSQCRIAARSSSASRVDSQLRQIGWLVRRGLSAVCAGDAENAVLTSRLADHDPRESAGAIIPH